MTLHIFSYGSNLLLARLKARVPSARFIGKAALPGHVLRWHKPGSDGSGKCDAFHTNDSADHLWGGIFEIDTAHKHFLDAAEGL
ncbi:MAG: gamma-glutamylcyclotransferase family protein, partial [Hyphomicrobiales bacterium]